MDVPVHGRFQAGMTKELLQGLRLHPAFDGPGGVGMAQSVHTKPFDSSPITELIQMGIVGAVLVRHTRAEVDKNKVFHVEALFLLLILPLVCVRQNGVQFGGLLAGILCDIDFFKISYALPVSGMVR